MSDWEPTLKIGRSFNGASAQPREKTLKGNSALNAANRIGGVTTEKKYTTGNLGAKAGAPEGQRMTKVDQADDIVKPPVMDKQIGQNIIAARTNRKLNQKQLATQANVPLTTLQQIERGVALSQVANPVITKLQKVLPGANLRQKKPVPK
ncbi:Multiprotein-bridging factor 1 [Penicillium brevicompactum]|uniref:Multiprotein-bridging factor 1 n=1 Tax=Penicillium brevicompactum TaxID=5074 RepID=UPI002540C146|nr:Multiprotein-bridging factor 1 [Penicillium brevicompactum]KAJ5336541.1 Multiprotein-bridging factor 1 [Penicillium brevicompactum]